MVGREDSDGGLPDVLVPMTQEDLDAFVPLSEDEIRGSLRQGYEIRRKVEAYAPSVSVNVDLYFR